MNIKYHTFIGKTFVKIISVFLLTGCIVFLGLYLHSHYFAWDIRLFLKKLGLYDSFIQNKTLLICLFVCAILFIFFVIIIIHFSHLLSQIDIAIEQLFTGNVEKIKLSKDLIEMESKLNYIYADMQKKTLAAKESEQRKNDLVVYLAHDLKTPLASVIGYLNLLNDQPDIPTTLRAKYVGITLERAQRLEDLINEFFEITRFNLQHIELNKSTINISMMLRQLIEEFYPMLEEKQLTITDQIASNLLYYGDGNKLARVFDNLLRNAINYCYPHSTITICAKQEDMNLILTFTNQGDMIPQHKLSVIFEQFYRVDSSRSSKTGGSGLGLAITKEIIRLHQGTIEAFSDEKDTKFICTLPIPTKKEEK